MFSVLTVWVVLAIVALAALFYLFRSGAVRPFVSKLPHPFRRRKTQLINFPDRRKSRRAP